MRFLVKAISAALSVLFLLAGMGLIALSIIWHHEVQLPYNLGSLSGTLVCVCLSLIFFLIQKNLFDEDGDPDEVTLVAFDTLANIVWRRFTTDPKYIGKIHLVSSILEVDSSCIYIRMGGLSIKWCQGEASICCIDVATGTVVFLNRRMLRKARNCLIEAFHNTTKVRWD